MTTTTQRNFPHDPARRATITTVRHRRSGEPRPIKPAAITVIRRRANALVRPLFVANLAVVVGLFWFNHGFANLHGTTAVITAAGRLTGLLAVNLCLLQLALMGRNPWLDRLFGMDRLARWHRVIGHSSFDLIVAHVVLVTVGYARLANVNVVVEVTQMVLHMRDVLMAAGAFVCFCLVVVTSYRIVRRKMRYETWFYVHLYAYLGIAMSVPHQIYTGSTFAASTPSKIYWVTFYALTVGSLLWFRFLVPLRNFAFRGMRVESVVLENSDVASVYITGRNLHKLRAEAGQFFIWRFLCKDHWWQAHPYSLSERPPDETRAANKNWLRVTVKDLGIGSASVVNVKPGTRVWAEGPYGVFTPSARHNRRVLLIGGGVGITPIRSLFESMPGRGNDIVVIYRASSEEDVVFLDEFRDIAHARKSPVHLVLGKRSDYPASRQPLSTRDLERLVPDVVERDVFICGPESLTESVVETLRLMDVPEHHIHYESFAF